ncbi:MAG: Na+/H+ antiporter subunit E [Atribacterota bacterium]|jgi:multicomponent Na+:H+ antiporter subunit E|nr:Na+/H+ antiporter subunit E [Atribacterota bacterium]MDD5496977.1 Na+/H+ antiporter subunit E [Atribacterota bacterium]
MVSFIVTFLLSFVAYLFLTASQGEILGLWSNYEIIAALIISLIVAVMASRVLFQKKSYHLLNPLRWVIFLGYLVGPFFFAMAKANIDVAYRVITGKINPGIVKISPNLKNDAAITLLANSITLTPGTLSVDIDEKNNDLYIHWINVTNLKPTIEDICGSFPIWARRIAE